MRAGRTEACEIERLAAREFFARQREPRVREVRAELVEAGPRHGFRGEPSRQAKAGSAKSRMSRANPFLFQSCLWTSINHK